MSSDSKTSNIIIFASGSGSNAENICNYFSGSKKVKIDALFCNNPNAGVIERMKKFNVPVVLFDRAMFKDELVFPERVKKYQPDLIVLAGFLWLMPPYFLHRFPNQVINVHPALLPKFGGKGMYGRNVHQ